MTDDTARPSRGRPTTLDADATLDLALEAYWKEDPADVSVNAICRRAGVSKPSLYRAFGGEDGLMSAALDRYAERVLSDVFTILHRGTSLRGTLDALTEFAARDPRMESGCLFYKMRAGKHRLGPLTRERVDRIDGTAVEAFAAFLRSRREAGDWQGGVPDGLAARFLVEQVGLALTQRASGQDAGEVEATLTLALRSLLRP